MEGRHGFSVASAVVHTATAARPEARGRSGFLDGSTFGEFAEQQKTENVVSGFPILKTSDLNPLKARLRALSWWGE